MALMLSIAHSSSSTCCSCQRFKKSGFPNAFCSKMGFNNLFLSVSRSWYRSKHKLAQKLLEDVDHFDKPPTLSHHSKLLRKVSAFVGFDGFNDLIENETAEKQSCGNLKNDEDTVDISLACKRFPSVILGSSPPVQLYDENLHCHEMKGLLSDDSHEGFLPNDVAMALVDPEHLHDQWPSVDDLSNMNISISAKHHDENQCTVRNSREEDSYSGKELTAENAHSLPSYSDNINLGVENNSDYNVSTWESFSGVQANSQSVVEFLDKSISCIPGITSRQRYRLENCGFHTLRKLLHHFPRTYADVQNPQVGVVDGQYLISVGKILSSRGIRANNSFSFLEVVVECKVADNELQQTIDDFEQRGKKTIYLHLKKFFSGARFASQPFLRSIEMKYKLGQIVCVSGKVKNMPTKDHYEIREYNIDMLQDCEDSSICVEGRPHPIYPSKGGLNPDLLRDTIVRALRAMPANIDPIPSEISQEFGLLSLNDAYIRIHMPNKAEDADLARRRLIFDEFFYLQLGRLFQMLEGLGTQMEKDALLDKYRKPVLNSVFMEGWSSLTKRFLNAFPYSLTPSQLSAVSEIIWDLKRPVPMSRLLQGDVGCGKTVVAFLACMEVIGSGYQAALMVPTELLALQHYEHLLNLVDALEGDENKPRIALLTGSTPLKQSRMIRKDLQTGDLSMVVGTHSLIAEKVEFSALRIAVVDEQHRFGVIQRGRFNSKLFSCSPSSKANPDYLDGQSSKSDVNMAPHILAMSATPIPRTLALALYGDVSLTQITDLPPGRIPVETHIIETHSDNFEEVYKVIQDELEAGGKIYVVYPIIEQSEQLPQLRAASADLEAISQRFPDYKCGLLHGRMKIDEKDEALRQFRCGETQILLATQVIEIGVDVPDASMMVVMNAERFGIAQLHQLRGRVGRGTKKSKCVLLASSTGSLNRLKVLEKSSNGFYLANMDLLLRGPGDLLGKKQSGHLPDFPIARLEVDGNILQDAHAAALKILGISHDLEIFPALKAELSMRQPLCILGD